MARTAVLGFPRIGAERELKTALEDFWAGGSDAEALETTASAVRADNLVAGARAGIDVLPVGDFALYDHVLDAAELFGIRAERHRGLEPTALESHFVACRGAEGVAPLELTKWFDTNYHYLVPELTPGQAFELRPDKWLRHLREADLGPAARPVVLGPLSLLLLAKGLADPLTLLPALASAYRELLASLAEVGAREVQLDEPCLVQDRSAAELDAFRDAYADLCRAAPVEVCLATYFGELDRPTLERVAELPIAELHVDLVRGPAQLDGVLEALPEGARLSAGVIDARNVWSADLDLALDRLDRVVGAVGSERLTIAPSCSLLHVPYSLEREDGVDPGVRAWLAFGREKLDELALLGRAVDAPRAQRDELLADARASGGGAPVVSAGQRRTGAATGGRAQPRRLRPARIRWPSARSSSASGWSCPTCRPRRSGPSLRRPRSATRAGGYAPASSTRRPTTRSCAARSSGSSPSRRAWAWTCSCTESPSATTWSSSSASS